MVSGQLNYAAWFLFPRGDNCFPEEANRWHRLMRTRGKRPHGCRATQNNRENSGRFIPIPAQPVPYCTTNVAVESFATEPVRAKIQKWTLLPQ